ncbi:LacI family transcriptional regulator [Gordonia McavH-238-E]|uniref:LacI family DNA-binding transcriptional regulator n=1 Tax=Gordonia sp. McavH-238-E TaxID=2917736 RepID=UPI001EF5289A|nr:LacI family DNA-binding transcriptional regulator [Gordonia sp. McavH-238-E]MCG7635269.1 LacI family transcriptional regulator [Gordonia sp. McavH-238-E]
MSTNNTSRSAGADAPSAVTLLDVARAAGVSKSTVSRVLDERIPPSRSATARRVREVANELGYRRNTYASNLRRGATATIGVVVPRLSDTVMALMFEAIERAAVRRGYFAIVATSGDDPADESAAASTLLDRNVDGLILASSRIDDPLPQQLRNDGVAHALVLRTDGKSPSAVGDDEAGGYLAVRHLVDLGHRDIGVLSGPLFTSSAAGRLEGARRALTEAGLATPSDRFVESGYGIEDGAQAARVLLVDPDARPTAVFCANDNLAIGAMSAAHEMSLGIGRDLSLIGYNDIPLAARLPTPLTSVRTAFDAIAAEALSIVLQPDPKQPLIRTILPTLIPRDSTRPFARP